jgi:pimeloyl-ACP methyl ester carboxylesterase
VAHIHLNGVDIDYVDEGTGEPVVFSHGRQCSAGGGRRTSACGPRRPAIPGAPPGCGSSLVTHFMSYQDPDRFNDTLLDYLAGVSG